MPLYLYECPRCSNIDEVLRSIGERDENYKCTECSCVSVRTVTACSIGDKTQPCQSNGTDTHQIKLDKVGIDSLRCKKLEVHDCTFRNLDTAIRVSKDTKFNMSGNRFINVGKNLEFTGD